MKKLWFLALAVFMTVGLYAIPPRDHVRIDGTLILADNRGHGMDHSLRAYERQLKRLNFASYKAIGKGGTQVKIPGNGVIQLGGGFSVELKVKPAPGNRIPVEIRWKKGKKTLIHTSGTLPLVLGGPGFQSGTLFLILDRR